VKQSKYRKIKLVLRVFFYLLTKLFFYCRVNLEANESFHREKFFLKKDWGIYDIFASVCGASQYLKISFSHVVGSIVVPFS
jgi:hypothetical protein